MATKKTPDAKKALRSIRGFERKLDPVTAPLITEAAWPEIEYRLRELQKRIDELLEQGRIGGGAD